MTAWPTVAAAERSAVFRRNSGHLRRELACFVPRARHVDVLGRRWLFGQREARAPFGRRADWPRREAPAAVRADVAELADAAGAERALVGTDHGVSSVRREVLHASFAVGAKLECHQEISTGTS